MFTVIIVILAAAALVAGVLLLHSRVVGPRLLAREGRPPSISRGARARAGTATWLRGLYRRWADWRDRPRGDGPGGTGKWGDEDGPFAAPAPRASPGRARRVAAPPAFEGPQNAASDAEIGLVQNSVIPAVWVAVIEAITSFEPENHVEHLQFFSGTAAGLVGVGEAIRANADTQLNRLGLDPAAVQATVDMADSVTDCAHDVMLGRRKFLIVYKEILLAIENGLKLPHRAREWLSGDAA